MKIYEFIEIKCRERLPNPNTPNQVKQYTVLFDIPSLSFALMLRIPFNLENILLLGKHQTFWAIDRSYLEKIDEEIKCLLIKEI